MLGWLTFSIIITIFLFILTASFWGWRFDIVSTGSMEPAYNTGGMVVTKPAEVNDIKVGDVILFRQILIEEEARICHRVIDIEEIDGNLFFQTKGDANEYSDSDPVSSQNLIGKTILYIPNVGNISYLLHLHETPITLMGKNISVAFILISALGLTVISVELKNMWEWISKPHAKKRQERLKIRRERYQRRVRRFA